MALTNLTRSEMFRIKFLLGYQDFYLTGKGTDAR